MLTVPMNGVFISHQILFKPTTVSRIAPQEAHTSRAGKLLFSKLHFHAAGRLVSRGQDSSTLSTPRKEQVSVWGI